MKQRSIIAIILLLIIICGVSGIGMADANVDIRVNGGGVIKVNNIIGGDLVSLLGNVESGPDAVVKGEITKIGGPGHVVTGFFGWEFSIFRVIVFYGLAVLVFVLIPKHQRRMTAALMEKPVRKLFIGFIALFALPVVISVAGISLIGIPLIPFMILSFIIAKFIGYVAVVLAVGGRIRTVGNFEMNIFLQLLAGVVILWLIRSLAVIGVISYLVVTALAVGTIIDTKFGTNRPWFNKEEFREISENDRDKEEEGE